MEKITLNEAYERFDNYLDCVEDDVVICGMHYDPSKALKALDPIAYKEVFTKYIDSLIKDKSITVEGF